MNTLKNRGFTLVELLIVVAVIAVLASIGIAYYRYYSLKAKVSEAKVNIESIRTCEITYASETSNYLTTRRMPPLAPTPHPVQWVDTDGLFSAIGFKPAGAVYFRYKVAKITSHPIDLLKRYRFGKRDTIPETADEDIVIIAAGDLDGDALERQGSAKFEKYSYYGSTDENREIFGPQHDDF